ncbi:MAG: nicotinate phosphoribosyltransferase, partial [Brachybacterium sp.]|nr:nicotinate phosphoribosyltransferase [Brachybacterium sp.]
PDWTRTSLRSLQHPLIVGGEVLEDQPAPARVEAARAQHAASVAELGLSPDDGPDGPVAIPTITDGAEAARLLG